jgi:hypothetical protein
MYRVRQEELPFVGSSHEFIGAEQGNVGVSVFLFSGLPGKGPGPDLLNDVLSADNHETIQFR